MGALRNVFLAGMLALGLAGCGGGGAGGDGSGGGGGTGTTPTITLTMTDPTSGANKTNVSAGDPALITATVKNGKVAIERALVTFSIANNSLATLTPQTGTALTDANGEAKVRLDAAAINSAGATTISASTSVTVNGTATPVSGSINFSVGVANVTLSNMRAVLPAGTTVLSPYATTSIAVNISGVGATTSVPITFTSTCANSGKATIDATANSANGVATATYADNGCASTDVITASVAGTAVTASLQLPVQAPSAAAIQFVSATPSTIVIKGTGATGLVESSTVTFRLVDNNNQPIANQTVTLGLTTRSGGILLDGTTTGTVSKQTNSDGRVSVSVSSGTTPTAVWVTASHTTPLGAVFQTQSAALQVSTGRPAQDRVSLSIETPNIEGWKVDGVTTNIRVIASDRVGNPVPDGTAINFLASGGQIGTSSQGVCTTTNGTCSVVYTSANPRPANGRVAIVAYALGEEQFRDANGNNVYDTGESFHDLGEVFVDNDLDGVWDLGEQAITFANNTTACTVTYSGAVPPLSKAGTCDGVWGAAHVRQNALIILSSDRLVITSAQTDQLNATCTNKVSATFQASDEAGNALPDGTELSIANAPEGWTTEIVPPKVQKATGPTSHTVFFGWTDAANCTGAVGFPAQVRAETPRGNESSAGTITVRGQTAPPPSPPAAPTGVVVTRGTGNVVVVSFTGSSNATGYSALCSDTTNVGRTATASGTASPISVSAWNVVPTAGDTISCTVTATNTAGSSPASAAGTVTF